MRTTAAYCRPLAGVPARGTENQGKGYRDPREERRDSPSRIDQARNSDSHRCEKLNAAPDDRAPRTVVFSLANFHDSLRKVIDEGSTFLILFWGFLKICESFDFSLYENTTEKEMILREKKE